MPGTELTVTLRPLPGAEALSGKSEPVPAWIIYEDDTSWWSTSPGAWRAPDAGWTGPR